MGREHLYNLAALPGAMVVAVADSHPASLEAALAATAGLKSATPSPPLKVRTTHALLRNQSSDTKKTFSSTMDYSILRRLFLHSIPPLSSLSRWKIWQVIVFTTKFSSAEVIGLEVVLIALPSQCVRRSSQTMARCWTVGCVTLSS